MAVSSTSMPALAVLELTRTPRRYRLMDGAVFGALLLIAVGYFGAVLAWTLAHDEARGLLLVLPAALIVALVLPLWRAQGSSHERGTIAFRHDAIEIFYPAAMERPLRVAYERIRAVAVDRRVGRIQLPKIGPGWPRANTLIVFDRPQPVPPLRLSEQHGLPLGKTVTGVKTRVSDAEAARVEFAEIRKLAPLETIVPPAPPPSRPARPNDVGRASTREGVICLVLTAFLPVFAVLVELIAARLWSQGQRRSGALLAGAATALVVAWMVLAWHASLAAALIPLAVTAVIMGLAEVVARHREKRAD